MSNSELDPKLESAAPTVTVEVDVNELNMILGALQELPHRVVDGLLRKLMEQAQAQLAPQGE